MLAYLNKTLTEPQQLSLRAHNFMDRLETAIWIDLFSPSKAEEEHVEQVIGRDIPTREDMVEIEFSSRLYKEKDVLYMTAMMVAQSDSADPKLDPVTLILTDKQFITLRYVQSQSFSLFTAQVKKMDLVHRDPVLLLIALLDAIVDRLADILEVVAIRLDKYSKTIFRPENTKVKLDFKRLMQQIGADGDLNTKARESLVTFNRLITFLTQSAQSKMIAEGKSKLAVLSTDIASLSDYANFLSTKINFLLDATLGMVNIEQNNIIKIFSVAAVIFLPPTLVASIYGMNFHFIPELSWKYGYIFAIGMIVTAAWLPYKYFRYKKWL